MPRAAHLDERSYRALCREAAIAASFRHPSLPRVHAVERTEGQAYIIMEYVPGETLASELLAGRLPEARVRGLMIHLAEALAVVHRHGWVHRDVKPANIVVGLDGRAHLLDFGLATGASEGGEDVAVGSFSYAAPEQTGMLRRPLDARADLYALGAVAFECLTGRPPFAAADPGELIRLHATQPAPDLAGACSAEMAAVVARLLAKDPDDRYQSAWKLLFALEAQGQHRSTLEAPATTLIGRQTELDSLRRHLRRATGSAGGFVLVEGPPGCGKSSLIRELLRDEPPDLVQLFCKCTKADTTPMAPIRAALDAYCEAVLSEAGEALERLRTATLPHAAHLVSLSDSLGRILDLPPSAAEPASADRFRSAVADTLIKVGALNKGLVVVVDEVQWADDSTLRLLRQLAAASAMFPVLLLVTSRDTQDTAADMARFQRLCGAEVSDRLRLQPLSCDAIAEILTEELGHLNLPEGLAAKIHQRTQGSPLAAKEFARALRDAGVLRPAWDSWELDHRELTGLELPSDVMALILRRVGLLSPRARNVLGAAAVLGSVFAIDVLTEVAETDTETVLTAIAAASQAQLVERDGPNHRFVHDRVLEAFLRGLEPDERRAMHRRASTAFSARVTKDANLIFAVARHLMDADEPSDQEATVDACLRAGTLALQNAAETEAYELLTAALGYRRRTGQIPSVEHLFALGQACVRTARVDEALAHLRAALGRTENPRQRAGLRDLLADAHLIDHRTSEANRECHLAFAELHASYPALQPLQVLYGLWLAVLCATIIATGRGLGTAKGHAAGRHLLLARLYRQTARIQYFESKTYELALSSLFGLYSALRIDSRAETVLGLGGLGVAFGFMGWRRLAERILAVGHARAGGQATHQATIAAHACWTHDLAGEGRPLLERFQTTLDRYEQQLDSWVWGNLHGAYCLNLISRGLVEPCHARALRGLRREEKAGAHGLSGRAMTFAEVYAGASLAMLARHSEAFAHLETARIAVEADADDVFTANIYLGGKLLYLMEQGETGAAIDEVCDAHEALGLPARATAIYLRYFWAFQGWARLHQLRWGPKRDGPLRHEQLRSALATLRREANVPALRCHLEVLEAALAAHEDRGPAALRHVKRAEDLAMKVGNPLVRFEAAWIRGLLRHAAGDMAGARDEVVVAHALATRHSWVRRAGQVVRYFHLESTKGSRSRDSSSRTPEAVRVGRQLDALLQMSLAAAEELAPRRRAQIVLDEIVRLLAAERGLLFLVGEQDPDTLELFVGRDALGVDINDASTSSQTVVRRAQRQRRAVVLSGTDRGELLEVDSFVAHGLRSVMAAPVTLRDRVLGVVYVDSRLVRGIFNHEDLQVFQALANHLAVALETSRVAEEIRHARDRALEASEAKSHFLATMSHELRTPINVIKGYTELVREDLDPDEQIDLIQDLDRVLEASGQLLHLVSGVLEVTELETDRLQPEFLPIELPALARDLELQVLHDVERSGNQLEVCCADDLPLLISDRARLARMLEALLVNAAKFTQNGAIKLEIWGSEDGHQTHFAVSDTGIGIAPEEQDRVFDAFYQVDMSTTRRHGGVGIGLELCQRVAEFLGGSIQLESEVGAGSRFEIVLPTRPEQAS